MFERSVTMVGATLKTLALPGTRVPGLSADGVDFTGGVHLHEGFRATGEVRLLNARIGGDLDCSGGSFTNTHRKALSAAGVDVSGNVFLRGVLWGDGFAADGEVLLLNARIGGDLDCSGGSFTNKGGNALSADGVDVSGGVFLRRTLWRGRFAANGEVRLPNARIGGDLDCSGGSFTNKGGNALSAAGVDVSGNVNLDRFKSKGEVSLPGAKIGGNFECSGGSFTNKGGNALSADHVNVTGNVNLLNRFESEGGVRLFGAKIGGQLACVGSFTNPNGYALLAVAVDVTGNVFLPDGFTATGEVWLAGARIGGNLECNGGFTNADGDALAADGVHVTGNVFLSDGFTATGKVRLPVARVGGTFAYYGRVDGVIELQGASVGPLFDDVEAWPDGWRGDGFSYRDFDAGASADVNERLAWLALQEAGFRPGPYSQLAAVYRRRGHPEAARRVLITREQQRTGELALWRQPLHRVWGGLSKYGYQPWRAIVYLLALIGMSAVVFWFANALGDMATLGNDPRVVFFPLVYAADLAVPLVDLRQASDYQPSVVWAQWCMWATIGFGWFLSGAFLAAVTGIFKPDE